jgi:steroid delta-isomerase-like uncharacterized protein
MQNGQNKSIVIKFLEASTASDQEAFKETMSLDFVGHVPGGPKNREGFLQHNSLYAAAFSNAQYVVQDQIAEDDKVVTHATWRGTHSGSFQGLPPTGKQISISAILIERVKDGKVVEHWSLFDSLSMMQQLGLLPPPQAAR